MRLPRKLKKRLKRSLTISPRQKKHFNRTFKNNPVLIAVALSAYRAAARVVMHNKIMNKRYV